MTGSAAPRIETREDAARALASAAFHEALGLELLYWGEEAVTLRFSPPLLVRSHEGGAVHGGALATVLDVAACFAVIRAVGVDCTTVDLRADFLRPALDDELRARGSVLRAGRRFAFAEAAVETLAGKLIATARGTFTW